MRPNLDQMREELGDRGYVEWCLEGAFSPRGQAFWWDRPRAIFDGKTAEEMWDDGREDVIRLAEWLLL